MSIKYSFISKWLRSIDHKLIAAICCLSFISILLVSSAGPVIAGKIGVPSNYFIIRHITYLVIGFFILISISTLEEREIKITAIISTILVLFLLIIVKFYGYEIKGARRWINIVGFSMQPSEFLKPLLAVLFGWLLSIRHNQNKIVIPAITILYLTATTLLITQPDLGMLIMVTAIFSVQLFTACIPIIFAFLSFLFSVVGTFLAYLILPHVKERINSFIFPKQHENYQISMSLEAFKKGNLFGTGPGDGRVKSLLPDSHCDFIFSVAGEEYGIIMCIFIAFLFGAITVRGYYKLIYEKNLCKIYIISGLLAQFGMQSFINMAVALNLLPTKGMTLPFISYGGSSTIAISINLGILIALTKKNSTYIKPKLYL